MPKKPVAMISSTVRDLPDHRDQAMRACLDAGFFPTMMESLPAKDADAIAASLQMVDGADVYIGIFAHRYGHVPAGHSISITQMEYNRAKHRKIARFLFLMHENHLIRIRDVEFGRGAKKLLGLKDRIAAEQVVGFFESPEQLRYRILHSLSVFKDSPMGKKLTQ